jgi:hypothetical protein
MIFEINIIRKKMFGQVIGFFMFGNLVHEIFITSERRMDDLKIEQEEIM